MSPFEMAIVISILYVWTAFSAFVAMVGHLLTLGKGDISMFVARFLWWPLMRFVCSLKLVVEGQEHIRPGQTVIIAANHQGVFDIPVLFAAFPGVRIRFVAKKALFWIPIFGWYLWLSGYIAVDRGNRKRAFQSLDRAAERLKRHCASVVIFPEGTRTHDGNVHRFKKGAAVLATRTNVPLQPVAIAGSYTAYNRNRWQIMRGTTIYLRILPLIATDDIPYEDRQALTRRLQAAVTDAVEDLRKRHGIVETEATTTGQAQAVEQP